MAKNNSVQSVGSRAAEKLKQAVRATSAKPAHAYEETSQAQSFDGLNLNVRSFERIQTAAQAMEKAGIDPIVWEPVRITANSWEVAVRDADDSIITKPLWQVKVECKRRIPDAFVDVTEALAKRLPSLKLPPYKYKPAKEGKNFLVIAAADFHIGKDSIDSDSDLKTIEDLFVRMVDTHIMRCGNRKLDEIFFVNLGDMLHVDTALRTTTNGTQQDCSGGFHDIYEAGMVSVLRAIERCRETAPVTFLTTQGNHDWSSSMHIASAMNQVFRNTKDVTVDNSPLSRKYIHRGKCLIGMSHGNNEKPAMYPGLMMTERPKEFADAVSRIFLKGHFHTKSAKRTAYKLDTHETIESDGCCVYTMPSPAGLDFWHDIHGYVGNRRCSQSFLMNHEHGLASIHEVGVKEIT